MLKKCGLFSLSLLLSLSLSTLFAQESDLLLTNSQPINSDRYKGIKGDPYMFDEWRRGKIISEDADAIENVLLNFNGQTNGFEIKQGDKYIELDPSWYLRVVVEGEKEGEKIVFQKNFYAPLNNKFTRIVYKGKTVTVVEDFKSKVEKKVINNVGKNEEIKTFYNRKNYFLIKDKKPVLFRTKKKSLLPMLGMEKELESYMKKEKLKLNSEKDLIQLLTHYDSLKK